jgi:hypothetical protein
MRTPPSPTRPLFVVPVVELVVRRRQLLGSALAELPDEEILGRKLDELVDELLDTFRLEPLTLEWGATTPELRTVYRLPRTPERSNWSLPATEPGAPEVEVSILVPFAGAPGLFDFCPSESSSDTAVGFVRQTDLRLTSISADHDIGDALADLERQEVSIKHLVSALNRDLDAFNQALPGEIRQGLSALLDGLQADRKLSDALGIPRRRSTTSVCGGRRRVGSSQATGELVPDPPQRRGRPEWRLGQFQTSWRKAIAATPERRTYERLALNFRALDGHLGVSADYLRRLRRRFRRLAE